MENKKEELEKLEKELRERERRSFLRRIYYEERLMLYKYFPEKLKKLAEQIKADPYIGDFYKSSFLKSIEKYLGETKERDRKKLEYVI